MTVQELLEAITRLTEAERRDLLARLRDIYGNGPAAPARPKPARADWERQADYMLVFDGGSQGNPGRAYGSYIIFNDKGSGQVERLEFDDPLTNNEAEYQTLLAALRDLHGRLGARAGQVVLVVRGDSQLVIEQLSGNYRVREPRLRALADQAGELLAGFKRFHLVWQSRADTLQLLGH